MTSAQLRLAQLEELLKRLDEEVDLSGFELQEFVNRLIRETPEESLEIYKNYLSSMKKVRRVPLLTPKTSSRYEC